MMLIVRPEYRGLLRSALTSILLPALVAVPIALLAMSRLALGPLFLGKSLVILCGGAALVLWGLPGHHPFREMGLANQATITRGVLVVMLAALIGEHSDGFVQSVALAIGVIAAILDGVDGWLARRTNMASRFGARFDMETDALFIFVLAALAWQLDKAGAWVLLSGLLRYGFVMAGLALPWLRAPLPPSFRRKTVAVLQVVALLFVIAPFISPAVSAPIAGAALITLTLSFLTDVTWLKRQAERPEASTSGC
jgi:phosphatidylglycerophosphate synthase